jgi:hypothetical protein
MRFRCLEEFAAMAHLKAAVGSSLEMVPKEEIGIFRFDPSAPRPIDYASLRFITRVFYPTKFAELTSDSEPSEDAWKDILNGHWKDKSFNQLRYPLAHATLRENKNGTKVMVDTTYSSLLASLHSLAKEMYIDAQNPVEKLEALSIVGQYRANAIPLLKAFYSCFGESAVHFLSGITPPSGNQFELDNILLSFFARAQNLQRNARELARQDLCNYVIAGRHKDPLTIQLLVS